MYDEKIFEYLLGQMRKEIDLILSTINHLDIPQAGLLLIRVSCNKLENLIEMIR